jgi:hypothetical protein
MWKSKDSMSLIMATKSEPKLKKEVRRQIKMGCMRCSLECIKDVDTDYIDRNLSLGYIMTVKDGERIWGGLK